MAQDPSKTEKATTKRRKRTRNEGNVPKSSELTKAIVLLMGVLTLRSLIGFYQDQFIEIYEWTFREGIHTKLDPSTTYALFVWGVKKLAIIVLPLLFVLAFTAWLTLRLQVGGLWTTKPMKPKFAKMFNIVAGLKRLLISPQAFVRLGRSILQALAVGIAPYIVIKQELPNLLPLFHASTHGIIAYILGVGYKMACYALVPMLLIAIADLWYSRWKYEEGIKMTKDEIKDERRQAEGDPHIKRKQQQKMLQMMASRMFKDIPKADVVITNPTHFAVALQYDALVAPAPLVLAKGVNRVAERIKEVARENSIPIEVNPPLARALYKQVEIGETIPEEMFQAVAAILAKLDKFKRR
ncbi:MAG: flagellar biosynthesis protein FlhB [Pseudodesulfovibrio sp.]|uniref:Flagellar biosynthetic protein FlhB n=1 Tax=Pseudodesulfovibrio aespoeensis (strain ATCC 700646 / DSM 10631 / Aspo-2) TaxID=643562 RepID=E6VVD6_PSEA9|nr:MULTISPECIES: flagellar biosynthesis protein FlhB [Pseudodesulfovibrio]MBU4379091.1 flagellar biosynthesis protein FlhB [Pseudomonadota bacterium]ADU62380.1 type III secretion exporter [Pseudodesulfovibrio aespoeensis Aspo-2]MBU4473956.1 flagellar biosynthesis protein FlhB [Pseudomonadota bacterium]MBU4515154.1 flagellar biosynthesis protein FlhB [Pseudomonadota bacterium]MBU4521059.1 flagellar biosynthesis protein FlhB [Pseudomonadota bacterium]